MIAALVLFPVLAGTASAEMAAAFKKSAPEFSGVPGLISKYYLFDSSGRGGAFYLWSSRDQANAFFDEQWRQSLTRRYGAPPSLSIFEVPVTVTNGDAGVYS
ncbi:YdhR family protein [Bradyrhizobium sp. BR 1432]|uniref:YdhR family protein n=1 Tax=Bradyrhizobium sp. BR 1432 TaxID=3447966 RepID=UPI003EE56084